MKNHRRPSAAQFISFRYICGPDSDGGRDAIKYLWISNFLFVAVITDFGARIKFIVVSQTTPSRYANTLHTHSCDIIIPAFIELQFIDGY